MSQQNWAVTPAFRVTLNELFNDEMRGYFMFFVAIYCVGLAWGLLSLANLATRLSIPNPLAVVGVTLFVLITLGSERITHALQGTEDVPLEAAFTLIGQAVIFTSAMTIVPAVALVIVGEVARIRSIYYYVLGGGLAVVAGPALVQLGQGGEFAMPAAAVWQVLSTAGFLGGFTYWLIAGRTT